MVCEARAYGRICIEPPGFSIWHRVSVAALKASVHDALENDLATQAREITSRHRADRRSLLPPRRVMPQRGMPPAASAETPVAALGRGCACQRAAVLDHDAAPTVDLSCATSPTGCRTEVREGKTSPFCRWGRMPTEKARKPEIAYLGNDQAVLAHSRTCASAQKRPKCFIALK